ncbi:growth hormone receptor [Austrofundulus limnaeus]|uniref:Growth hormone receptor n=1 Tax=Austrofundulus limnaeus TaxID=52670 RepID=A0A2I4CB56_AUSLI|nr:PREDICTED: growth hormone receptor-like [Austrofundulus limnaeus]
MLWLLFCLLPLGGSHRISAQEVNHKGSHDHEEMSAVNSRPQIYNCRSSNMEDFTCRWHPLSNLTGDNEVTYVLIYSKEKGPKKECPDYVSAGPNSCHFNKHHTAVWQIYCMNVTAITAHRNYTSPQYCVDVADIVETEAPVNLTYELTDAGGDEMGHSVLLSWTYPVPEVQQSGWITLEYELQYRRLTESDNWKPKNLLREPHVELLGLRVGDYAVRVRCRSHNSGLWSKWSSTLLLSIPNRLSTGKVLVLVLVVAVGVVALLVIVFGIFPQSRRIKEYFLPPIPKPRIIGIDPLLLKKGNLEEINHHFSNFHSYRPPSYSVEVWDQVSADGIYLTSPKDCRTPADVSVRERESPGAVQHQFSIQNPLLYIQSVPPYCSPPPEVFAPLLGTASLWQRSDVLSVPGTDYSMMEQPGVTTNNTPSLHPTSNPPQDFYTCVHLMKENGEVHLVPCFSSPYCRDLPPFQTSGAAETEEEENKKKRLVEYQASMSTMEEGSESERSEAATPLLPVSVHDTD